MSSPTLGAVTCPGEVTNISRHGFWLLVDDHEYFVPFGDYPEFLKATVCQIYNVQCLDPRQFHWPDLDMDIELDALERPEAFPLEFRAL